MRRFALVAVALAVGAALGGCSDGGGGASTTGSEDEFEGFDDVPEATDTKGVLLGVVVDEAIRPVPEAKVSISLPDGSLSDKTTDTEGRFAYGELEPGTYLIQVTHLQYTAAQTSAEVVAGDKDPPVHRILISRLFDQEPFFEQVQFDGFLSCAFAVGVSSTCVNDYTRVVGRRCAPDPNSGPVCTDQCAGGCFKEYELAKAGGNIREYVSSVGPGWQSIVFETTWEPTTDTGRELGFTVSYFSRPNANHIWASAGGEAPLREQIDVGVEHEDANYMDGEPPMVPINGTDELFVFYSAGGAVVVNQQFRSFQTAFYYAIPPEGWSFIAGDPMPF